MVHSIEQLQIYKSARSLEDEIYEFVRTLPSEHFYGLGNDLRRSSAAVSHHISNAHKLFSYRLKLDEFTAMRREAEVTQRYINDAKILGINESLINKYQIVIKQSWGLTKWLKAKLEEKQEKAEIAAKEQLASLA
jgi:four helix bundle protein